jgi:hypothetical protein
MSREALLHSAQSLCNDFASKEPLEKVLDNFSVTNDQDIVCWEHGLQHSSVPFLGRVFRGRDGAKQYFELIANLLSYENMKFSDYFVDVEKAAVSVQGEATFTWRSTGHSWDEIFTYRLRFDSVGKVTRYEVWADSLAAYLAGAGQLLANKTSEAWEPLEGTPRVFNALAQHLGLNTDQWHFADVLALEEDMVPDECAALILLYPTASRIGVESSSSSETRRKCTAVSGLDRASEIAFWKQVVGGTCGTLAVTHAIANALPCHEALAKSSPCSPTVVENFTKGNLSMVERSHLFVTSEVVRQAHQAAVQVTIGGNGEAGIRQGYHFVTFVHRSGCLWEIDGRRSGPTCLQDCTCQESFVADALAHVRSMLATSRFNEQQVLRCSVVALVRSS